MVKIIEYKFEEKYRDSYLNLIENLYSEFKGIISYKENIRKLLSPINPFFKNNKIWNFIATEESESIGHISAIIDNRSPKIGLIGFFECVEDKQIFDELLNIAIQKLKSEGCNTIIAPINLTIWHGYRFTIDQDIRKVFYFEPLSKKYYDIFFRESGFSPFEEYYSAERTSFDSTINLTKKNYERVISDGYKIRVIDLKNLDKELEIMYNLSKDVFCGSKNYVELNMDEFKFLYSDINKKVLPEFVEIITDPLGNDVGFCFSVPDPLNTGTIIMKTIAIKSTERMKGLGAALIYSQHQKANKFGFNRFVYALIREDNAIKKLPYPDARIISRYTTYQKSI